ncbi:MAG: hypothetical protein WD059_04645 [Balneolaceae bacterium]
MINGKIKRVTSTLNFNFFSRNKLKMAGFKVWGFINQSAMKVKVSMIVWLLTATSIYILVAVGLEILPKIPSNFTNEFSEKLNIVLLNISYSYLAAIIFYLLINYFSFFQKKKRFQPYVKKDIQRIHSLFLNIINAMGKKVGENFTEIPDKIKFEYLLDQVSPNELYSPTKGMITQATYMKTFLYLKVEAGDIIKHIHLFKEFVPDNIISYLEDLNNSQLFKSTVIFNSWSGGVSNTTLKMFASPFYDGFEIVKKLKEESDKLFD